jgi:hypothetical protein
MLKILEPNPKGASLGCRAAPLENGSRIYEIPANGSIVLNRIRGIDYLSFI